MTCVVSGGLFVPLTVDVLLGSGAVVVVQAAVCRALIWCLACLCVYAVERAAPLYVHPRWLTIGMA